jgi:8-oxo-dGTP pyrophosphatase MutT (NUDIX family)
MTSTKSNPNPPVHSPLVGPPVVPRDAASLMLLRETSGTIEVLMGQRHTKSPFMPDIYVFPGGKIEADDWNIAPCRTLDPAVSVALRATSKCSEAKATALANAAIRETWEEVGLMLAEDAEPEAGEGPWAEFTGKGLKPDHGALRMIGRAITPTNSPYRFHARFLAAHASRARGELTDSNELADLGWHSLDEALKLPIIDVTECMLGRVRDLSSEGLGFLDEPQREIVFASYRNQKLQQRFC